MSRRSKARISRREKSELQRLNRNANAKIKRIEKDFGKEALDMIPQVGTKKLKDLKGMTRSEINEYKDQLERFTRRGNMNYQFVKNEGGRVIGTKAEVQQAEREVRRINRIKEQHARKSDKNPFRSRGKETGMTVGERRGLGDPRYNYHNLNFDVNQFGSRQTFKQFVDRVDQQYEGDFMTRRNKQYRRNYRVALINQLGKSPETIALARHIHKMDLEEFMEMYYTEDIGDINFLYDPETTDAEIKRLTRLWGVPEQ